MNEEFNIEQHNEKVKAHYSVDKKLSQFNKFQYLWNFDISWWMFRKKFVIKNFN
jgi:hypothetical protein